MKKRNSYFTRLIILASVILLAANLFLGMILTNQSGEALRTQIRARMLDVSESAAALLDGDALGQLTAEDEGTEPYQKAMDTLRVFQEHVDLAYIYGIRDMGDGTFTFTIDPTVDDPGAFGEPVKYTDALYSASLGISAVDEVPYEDRWGRFYSAYSPVFDSRGKVAGIVGVDFEAGWYEQQIARHRTTVFVIGLLSLLVGGLVAFLLTNRLQRRFMNLNTEMRSLKEDMEELAGELRLASGRYSDSPEPQRAGPRSSDSGDIIEEFNDTVHEVRDEMRKYIADAHALAYTDAMTGTGNRTAYFDTVGQLNEQITEGWADFSIAVFDINGLKKVNDAKGHEYGDKLIVDAAEALKGLFQAKNVYRIGGDEFIAILTDAPVETLTEQFAELDRRLVPLNRGRDIPLTISKGAAAYRRGEDKDFITIFRRADEAMYGDKARYYASR